MSEQKIGADKSRKIAIALAFAGALPLPLPVAWIHKFYLGQYLWGVVYLVLFPTGLPKVACCLEGLWYASQSDADFSAKFPAASETLAAATALSEPSTFQMPNQVSNLRQTFKVKKSDARIEPPANLASLLRDLDALRKEGLITEYEFEQKRRKLLDQIK